MSRSLAEHGTVSRSNSELTFAGACARIERALAGASRRDIVASVASRATNLESALVQLRAAMRSNTWPLPAPSSDPILLDAVVSRYDGQTRRDGFHALHDWDGIADRINADTIPVDVLTFLIEQRGKERCDEGVLAILLDYYFLYLLALLSLEVWDEGDADRNLDLIAQLLRGLQGPGGSGQPFVSDAETLLLIATSHYELYDGAYDRLLDKVRTLNEVHRLNIALGHAASLGSHLRFGFEATYGRDTVNMRNDNVADYPWLSFSLATLMREYARLSSCADDCRRSSVVEALLNGLSPDARAFVGRHPPASLDRCKGELEEFQDRFRQSRGELLDQFDRFQPGADAYSPLSFFFNFSHNVLKGTIVDALLRGAPWEVALNDLFTGVQREGVDGSRKTALANVLMGYARANPHRIRGRLMPVIVYDPQTGRQAFNLTLRRLRGLET
jgi:hypothetical protein